MAHFAEINSEGTVIRVIVADQEFIDSWAVGNPSNWIKTSFNTQAGAHRSGGTPLRKNFAGVGYTYNRELDAFIPPRPSESWTLDEEKCIWRPLKELPEKSSGTFQWDEKLKDWVETYAKR